LATDGWAGVHPGSLSVGSWHRNDDAFGFLKHGQFLCQDFPYRFLGIRPLEEKGLTQRLGRGVTDLGGKTDRMPYAFILILGCSRFTEQTAPADYHFAQLPCRVHKVPLTGV